MAESPPVHSWHIVGSTIISFSHQGQIPKDVWSGYIEALRTKTLKHSISVTWGAVNVDSLQRKAAAEAVKVNNVPVTVIANDRLTRGLVTAVSWLGANIRAFSWDQVDQALEGVPASDSERTELARLIREFHAHFT